MKLNSLLVPIVTAVLASSAFAGSAGKVCTSCQPAAGEPNGLFDTVGATATIGYDTDYVYRGVELAKNLITAALDWNLKLDQTFSLNAGAWYGTSADDSFTGTGGGAYHELDLYTSVLAKLGPVTAGLKYQHYFFLGSTHNAIRDINELGVTLATSVAGFDLGAGGYYDFTAKGWYFEYSASYPVKINDWLSLVPGVLVSHGHDYYGVNGGNHVKVGLAAPIRLTKTATLTPYIAGNLPIGSLKDNGERNRVYGGVALSVTF